MPTLLNTKLPPSFVPGLSRKTVTTNRGVLDLGDPMTVREAKGPRGYVLTFVSYESVSAAIADAKDATAWTKPKKGKSRWHVFLSTSSIRNPRTGRRGWLCTATLRSERDGLNADKFFQH